MGKWRIGWGIVAFFALLIIVTHSRSPNPIDNPDTVKILTEIDRRQNPWLSFVGDWPLLNHFYRPVTSLSFEIDHALHGFNWPGFLLTNAIIAAVCVFGLFWLLREVIEDVFLATAGAALFGLWHLISAFWSPAIWFSYGAAALSFMGFLRPGADRLKAGFACGAFVLLSKELPGLYPLRLGIIEWIPGRTASLVTMFGLLALASFARFERLRSVQDLPAPGLLDPPATRSAVRVEGGRRKVGLLVLSLGLGLLAFGCYEQAVMLPALAIGVVVTLRIRRYRVSFGAASLFWLVLIAYLVIRHWALPPGTSSYQQQAFRWAWSIPTDIATYLLPTLRDIFNFLSGLELGFFAVLVGQSGMLAMVLSNGLTLAGLWRALRERWARRNRNFEACILFGFLSAPIAYAPMAFLKPFGEQANHYHYWGMAFHSVFVACLLIQAGRWLIAGWSPRAIQAPQRPFPAPGSLPRP